MLPDEVQKHLDAFDLDETKLDQLRTDPVVRGYLDKVLVAYEPVIMSGLDAGESLLEAAVPGGALAGVALRIGNKLLEDAINRYIEKIKVGAAGA